jgi:hypothetical protein
MSPNSLVSRSAISRFVTRVTSLLSRCMTAAAIALTLCALPAQASDGGDLIARLSSLRDQLDASSFHRPMLLQASDKANGLQGDVYAIVNHPLASVGSALGTPEHWCEAMMLHINNRRCTVSRAAGDPAIELSVVRRYDQPVENAFHLVFDFQLPEATDRHLEVRLRAASGPLGTSNYVIAFEAVPVDSTHSFLHFSYTYDENVLTRTAMQAYLATFGRSKVGFTVLGTGPDGRPEYIRGTHALVERNAMRYFLSVEAYLEAREKNAVARRNAWYSATEKYPRQLHEIDRAVYLDLKAADERK